MAPKQQSKSVETLTHEEASRTNIPTAEYQSVMKEKDQDPVRVAYERRNHDLDPQLVWRGKDQQDWSDLVVHAPPLYIQEKVHPKALIDDLMRCSQQQDQASAEQPDLFEDFNGLEEDADRTDFYQHQGKWQNRMILGDSLEVMASLAEREGLRGQVQCIYLDPPYGIKFNSNFQWSTTSRDVKDGKAEHITRDPEQVKAFRDTWRDGIHSYLTYLRDRLTVARDLLEDSGSLFVQIGPANVHRVRSILDEVFGEENYLNTIPFMTTGGQSTLGLANVFDNLLWYAKSKDSLKYRQLFKKRELRGGGGWAHSRARVQDGTKVNFGKEEVARRLSSGENIEPYYQDNLTSQGETPEGSKPFLFQGRRFYPPNNSHWKTHLEGMERLSKADRIDGSTKSIRYVRYLGDFSVEPINNIWDDTTRAGYIDEKRYVVETSSKVIERCIHMATDPGDLVLDPTCGAGTTAAVAEQWGRRWIAIDTSRVALALARARIMGGRYPYYLLADSPEGQQKKAELTRSAPATNTTHGDIRQGFVYERAPHITLGSIANNTEIDVIWDRFQERMEPLRAKLNAALGENWEEWEIPREPGEDWPADAKDAHAQWWEQRIARQKEIDASIAAKADQEYLYDRPYEDKNKVRVAGPFTVESLAPHRSVCMDEDDELVNGLGEGDGEYDEGDAFVDMVLENLRTAGVQQAHKEDRINFTSLTPWPGDLICAEGRYLEGDEDNGTEKRAAIFVGPEFGTVSRPDLVQAAREAGDAGFDVLITCAFSYEAHAADFNKLGRIPVLQARMNADLHMAEDLKNTGQGNLFVIFGEPDIQILDTEDDRVQVKINGVDVFDPKNGEVRSDGPDGIACWFIDTDYNEESFFVRHAYFLGASDPYKNLKTTLKAEINEEAWETLYSDTSRPFGRPESGRIAVKVINHLGDEVMKVFRV